MRKIEMHVRAKQDVDGTWMIYAAVPSKDLLAMMRCIEKRNVTRVARAGVADAFKLSEASLKVTGVVYQ